jgi:Septum formation
MSSNPMGDAQPQAVAGVDHTLSVNIVDNIIQEGTTQAPAQPPEPVAAPEPAAATEPEPETADATTAPETATEPEPETVTEPPAEPETVTEPEPEPEPEPETATEPQTATEPAAKAAPEPDEQAEALAITHPTDETDPTDLIEMSEPVELAEPVEERPRARRGCGLLLGAVFFLAALGIIGGAFAVVGHLTHGFKKPVIITYKKSAVFSLRTGECIDPNGQAASLVPCTTAHEAEVFATFTLPASKWPGEAGVSAAASSGCADRLTGYLNPQLAISLATTYVYPDAVAWRTGTRTVICEVHATSGQLTGSVRGASAT